MRAALILLILLAGCDDAPRNRLPALEITEESGLVHYFDPVQNVHCYRVKGLPALSCVRGGK